MDEIKSTISKYVSGIYSLSDKKLYHLKWDNECGGLIIIKKEVAK